MVATTLMTAADLARLPDDGFHRYELAKGVLITMAPPGYGHGSTASQIAYLLRRGLEDLAIGGEVVVEAGFQLAADPDTVRGPDVAYVSAERLLAPADRAGYFPGAPDIVVEIVSPNDTAAEVLEKVQEYLPAGSRLVWVVESRTRTVTVYRPDGSAQVLRETDTLTGEDVLPGLSVPVRNIFSP
ncbi:MAG: Uma2 family endonuclease [Chloroflexi bacterium]|nr:Uma2 family endonuclease [Chloroflexota bacterium]